MRTNNITILGGSSILELESQFFEKMAHNIKRKAKKGIVNNEFWSFCEEANMVYYSETHLGCLKKKIWLIKQDNLFNG